MMFGAIKGWMQERNAALELEKLPAVAIAKMAIRENWSENHSMTQDFSRPFVEAQAKAMMQKVIDIATSETPWLANRAFLTECVLEYAYFAVLVFESPPLEDPTGLRGMPGITGELKPYVMDLARKDAGLREHLAALPHSEDRDAVWDFVVFRNRILWAWTSVFQAIRFAYNDHAPAGQDDWYRPFVAAMFAWQEDTYRNCLGLPSALEVDAGNGTNLRALWYSTFMNRVVSGDSDPLMAWRADLAEYEQS